MSKTSTDEMSNSIDPDYPVYLGTIFALHMRFELPDFTLIFCFEYVMCVHERKKKITFIH